GAGIGFFGMYVLYWVLIYAIARRLSGFRWSPVNKRLAVLFLPTIVLVFLSTYVMSFIAATTLDAFVALIASVYSAGKLCTLIPLDRLPPAIRKLLKHFPPTP